MGSTSFVSLFRAMGDRLADTDLSLVDTRVLLTLLKKIGDELAGRAESRDLSESSYSVIDPPIASSGKGSGKSPQGLLRPYSCGYHCQYCESPCTRNQGHTRHSCYEHRHRRQ